jgi:hypothetical protein
MAQLIDTRHRALPEADPSSALNSELWKMLLNDERQARDAYEGPMRPS